MSDVRDVALEYRDAAVGYDRAVVSGVCLAVHPGEVVGLIGSNGAGKSTMLRAVTGGARLVSGALEVLGRPRVSYDARSLARVVAALPQTVTATFRFSAREFVEMGRHPHLGRFADLSAADARVVDEAMELTDTARLAGEPVDTLSGGDLQRLTLAQTLAQQPRVLLLDEPTSHLDLNHRLQVLDLVRRLADEGLGVLAVFHDLDMAARYSDTLAAVHGGGVGPCGSPREVLTGSLLGEVFGVSAVIGTDAVTGAVSVTPVLRRGETPRPRGVRVHVVGGSGSAARLLRRLVLEGYEVTAAALNAGDTDNEVAAALGLRYVPLPPFAPVDIHAEAEAAALAAVADVVVVAGTPFGAANLGNLRSAVGSGSPVVLTGSLGPERDFTRGDAARIWDAAVVAGARTAETEDEVLEAISEVSGR
jgi:iron complex transport system ATP-binding protein